MKTFQFFSIFFFFLSYLSPAQNRNVIFRSQFAYPGQSCANVGGFVDTAGNEYALVGASLGLSIVNVSNPDSIFQVIQIPGPDNLWKEVKTYQHYAYVTTEGGMGLQIIDLSNLPDTSISYKHWMPGIAGDTLRTIHTLFIDTVKGFVYLYGSNIGSRGIVIADIKTDPWNPVYVGKYDQEYVHDGFVKNDTVYAAAINAGHFRIIDYTDKSNPNVLQTQNTPGYFTHNTWLSDDGLTLFTTDEVNNSFLTSYDISNLGNITELDRIQSNPGSNSIVHNTHILNDYAVTSWYKDGFTIVDAHRPDNLIQVGNYDTYSGSGSGFGGAWGVYPYLPSGTALVSSMDGFLYVLTPTYVRACYLEGTVIDSVTTIPINTAKIEFLSTGLKDSTKLNGQYATGVDSAGSYDVQVSKQGYTTRVISGVTLTHGSVTNLNIELSPLGSAVIPVQQLSDLFEIYPNPSLSDFTIKYKLSAPAKNAEIFIKDILGKIVFQVPIDKQYGQIKVNSSFEVGMYFVSIKNGEEISLPIRIVKAASN